MGSVKTLWEDSQENPYQEQHDTAFVESPENTVTTDEDEKYGDDYEIFKKCCKKYEDYGREAGVVDLLKDQLDKCQASLEVFRVEVVEEKQKNHLLSEQYSALEKVAQEVKAGVDILTKEKEDLKEMCQHHENDIFILNEKICYVDSARSEWECKAKNSENEAIDLKLTIEGLVADLQKVQIHLDEVRAKQSLTETNLTNANADILHYQSQLEEFENILTSIKDKDDVLQQRESELAEKVHEIEMLTNNLQSLTETLEKETGNLKVDVRILNREKKELEERCKTYEQDLASSNETISLLERTNSELEQLANKLENEVTEFKSTIDLQAADLKEVHIRFDESRDQRKLIETDLLKANAEILLYQSQLHELECIQTSIKEKDVILKQNEMQLQEKDNKMETLNTNLKLLKEACVLLEQQLDDFGIVMRKKERQLEKEVESKNQFEGEAKSTKDELRKARADLNEMISLKVCAEKQLKGLESYVESEEEAINNKIDFLAEQVSLLERERDELNKELIEASEKLDKNEHSNDHFKSLVKAYEREITSLKVEISEKITNVVVLKDDNAKLKEALQQAVQKAEFHKDRANELNEERILVEMTTSERELQQASVIEQQMKLIEYLRSQNEGMCKKKKFTFFNREKENIPLQPFEMLPQQQSKQRTCLFPPMNREGDKVAVDSSKSPSKATVYTAVSKIVEPSCDKYCVQKNATAFLGITKSLEDLKSLENATIPFDESTESSEEDVYRSSFDSNEKGTSPNTVSDISVASSEDICCSQKTSKIRFNI